jgi:hypothetical protein
MIISEMDACYSPTRGPGIGINKIFKPTAANAW